MVLFSLSIVSCEQKEKEFEGVYETKATNPKNPYDNIGILHNEMLGKILQKQEIKTKSGISTIPFNIATQELNLSEECIKEIEEVISFENYNDDFKDFINKQKLEENAKEILITLFKQIREKNENGLFNDFSDFKNDIEVIENNIILNESLTDYSKVQLLSLTATFRHSAQFWDLYLQENEIQTRAKMKWWKWLIFGAADAIGGFAGGGAFSVGGATGASSLALSALKE